MTKEQTIKHYMETLELSREEAEQLYKDDSEDFIGEEGEKLQAKANVVKPKADRKRRQPSTREPKVDNEKLELLKILAAGLDANNIPYTIEREVAIHFPHGEDEFTVKLTRHRPK